MNLENLTDVKMWLPKKLQCFNPTQYLWTLVLSQCGETSHLLGI